MSVLITGAPLPTPPMVIQLAASTAPSHRYNRCCQAREQYQFWLHLVYHSLALRQRVLHTVVLLQGDTVVLLQGDMIPWTLGQQFQDPDFPLLSGARVVRIAVHPDVQGAG